MIQVHHLFWTNSGQSHGLESQSGGRSRVWEQMFTRPGLKLGPFFTLSSTKYMQSHSVMFIHKTLLLCYRGEAAP